METSANLTTINYMAVKWSYIPPPKLQAYYSADTKFDIQTDRQSAGD